MRTALNAIAVDFAKRLRSSEVAPVACFGDIMLDRYHYGHVERISPEAPIPVLRVDSEALMLGGAGNVARNIASLEASVVLVGAVGDDADGRTVLELLSRETRVHADVAVDPAYRTIVKSRFVAGGQQVLRADWEESRTIDEAARSRIRADVLDLSGKAGAVILSDYDKGLLEPDTLRIAFERASSAGIPTVVDPKGSDYARYHSAALVTPNLAELSLASGANAVSDDDVVAAARKLMAECGLGAVLVTRGGAGMSLVQASGVDHIRSRQRDVFDVSGAGDTVVAVVAAALASGLDLLQAVELANVAGGIAVSKSGTATVALDEICADVGAYSERHQTLSLTTPEHAARNLESWRDSGLSIGFTNGCFDLLHPGHVSLLRFARSQCDRLVVGLNDDASVARLKGPSRPVQPLEARAQVLLAMEAVDMVVAFAEDTPLELIRTLRPDVLVKGADYERSEVVGGDLVEAQGGRVELAPLVPDESTTRIVSRVNGEDAPSD